jgi:hypothetical protein
MYAFIPRSTYPPPVLPKQIRQAENGFDMYNIVGKLTADNCRLGMRRAIQQAK